MHVKLLACLPSYYSLVLFSKIKINEMYLLTSSRFHAGVCVCVSGCMSAGMPDPLNFENLVWMHDLAPCRVMLWNH